jgi:acyl-CoA thioesterase-1
MQAKKFCGLRSVAATLSLLAALLALSPQARAETVRIVALGASNTYAQAVSTSEAWPAKLEAMLKAKGYDVRVSVKGVTLGDASQVYAAAQSIPSGTKVVVFDAGGGNSKDRGIDPAAYRAKTMQAIRAQGATPIFVSYKQIVGPEGGSGWIAGDPHHHFTAASHTRVAASVLPRVIAAIGKK